MSLPEGGDLQAKVGVLRRLLMARCEDVATVCESKEVMNLKKRNVELVLKSRGDGRYYVILQSKSKESRYQSIQYHYRNKHLEGPDDHRVWNEPRRSHHVEESA